MKFLSLSIMICLASSNVIHASCQEMAENIHRAIALMKKPSWIPVFGKIPKVAVKLTVTVKSQEKKMSPAQQQALLAQMVQQTGFSPWMPDKKDVLERKAFDLAVPFRISGVGEARLILSYKLYTGIQEVEVTEGANAPQTAILQSVSLLPDKSLTKIPLFKKDGVRPQTITGVAALDPGILAFMGEKAIEKTVLEAMYPEDSRPLGVVNLSQGLVETLPIETFEVLHKISGPVIEQYLSFMALFFFSPTSRTQTFDRHITQLQFVTSAAKLAAFTTKLKQENSARYVFVRAVRSVVGTPISFILGSVVGLLVANLNQDNPPETESSSLQELVLYHDNKSFQFIVKVTANGSTYLFPVNQSYFQPLKFPLQLKTSAGKAVLVDKTLLPDQGAVFQLFK